MRVAVVYFAIKNRARLQDIAKGLARGIEAQGHDVDLIDGINESDKKLTMYKYIALGTESTTIFRGSISPRILEYLASCGMIGGKRCFAFLSKSLFGTEKTLINLMSAMEGEGMFLKLSDILTSPELAEHVGKKLHIEA